MTKDERLALIASLAPKYNARTNMKKKVKASSRRAARYVDSPEREKVKRDFMSTPDGTNWNHWTDASKYAKEYYGEVMYETTRFDNDWG